MMTEEELKAIAERCERDDEKWGGVGLSYPDVFQMMGDRRHLLTEVERLTAENAGLDDFSASLLTQRDTAESENARMRRDNEAIMHLAAIPQGAVDQHNEIVRLNRLLEQEQHRYGVAVEALHEDQDTIKRLTAENAAMLDILRPFFPLIVPPGCDVWGMVKVAVSALRNRLADEGPVRTDVWVGGRSDGEARL